MTKLTQWHGTEDEMNLLIAAIRHACADCTCKASNKKCYAEELLGNQQQLDRMLGRHRMAQHILREGFIVVDYEP